MRQRMRLCVLLVFGVLFLQCAETKKHRKTSRSSSNSRSKHTKSSKSKQAVCGALDRDLDPNGIYILDGSNFRVDATATLRCDSGYGTSGNPIQITCQANGKNSPVWSAPTGVCEVNVCPVTGPTIQNGHYMLPMSPIVGTTAKLICDSMYEVSGEPSVCCLADGTWSTPGGTCERVCGVVPDDLDPNGIYVLDALDFGVDATATLICDSGYSTTVNPIRITCQTNGTSGPVWSAPTGVCEVNVCPVTGPTIQNGHYMLPMSPIVGTTAKLICDSMYEVSGEPSICCLADGTWSTPGGTCERVCGVPENLDPNGIFNLDALDFGVDATATLTCDSGYGTTGNLIQITCQADGTNDPVWSTPTEMCEVNVCRDQDLTIQNGVYTVYATPLNVNVGTIAKITCDPMYEVSGLPCIYCQPNGMWTTGGTCAQICGDFPDDTNGEFILNSAGSGVGATARLTCIDAYDTWDVVIITCQAGNGEGLVWSTPSDKCLPEECVLDFDIGPCGVLNVRYFYSSPNGMCLQFHYGGCGGNANNFLTQAACETACIPG